MTVDGGPRAPAAAARNAAPILEILQRILSPPAFGGRQVLEIAAGSGYHATTFARALPHLTWQASDPDAEARASIAAVVAGAALPNLPPPLALDVRDSIWPVVKADAVVCINMIHISPWAATLALFAGAARLMPDAGIVVTYGPYAIGGDYLAESNIAFDQSLRARNSSWGIRDLTEVASAAAEQGFELDETLRMPANNLTLTFKRR
ncbi:MAG: DUF938 domain-containing protein [Rhodospirillaceae bacterium]|nr:DUF938 domain-containing protein [Rhodospirillaceae bacterium]